MLIFILCISMWVLVYVCAPNNCVYPWKAGGCGPEYMYVHHMSMCTYGRQVAVGMSICMCTTCMHLFMESSWFWLWAYIWTTGEHVPMEGRWLQDAQYRQWEFNPGPLQVLLRTKPLLLENLYLLFPWES